MRQYFCDHCGKEIKYKEIKLFDGFGMFARGEHLDLCSECYPKFESKQEELNEAREKLMQDAHRKFDKIKNETIDGLKIKMKKETINET